MEAQRKEALARHLEIDSEEIEVTTYSDDTFEAEGAEYLVLTDEEADDKWDDYLESYIDECIFPEVPSNFQGYFDREAWKRDARYDGRGHSLSSYDGSEDYETVDGIDFYIYRTN